MATRQVSHFSQLVVSVIDSEGETEVGQGIKASGIKREELFLTTKLNNTDHKRSKEALEDSLKKLDTSYLDLCAYL
jgi:diketogulonate reductase-like aldo/keto reductase